MIDAKEVSATVLPVWLNLDYLTINRLLVLVLSMSISGYLAGIKKRSETTKMLGLAFAGISVFNLGLVIENAGVYYWHPNNLKTLIQPFLLSFGACLALLGLLLFAYSFPEHRNDFDRALGKNRSLAREFRTVLAVFLLLDLMLLSFTYYNSVYLQRLRSDFALEGQYTITLEATCGFQFAIILFIILRKVVTLAALPSRSIAARLINPGTEEATAARGIMVVFLMLFAAIVVWILRFMNMIPGGLTAFLVWLCFALFHAGFVVTYINHTEERAPFVVKLVAGALITVFSVLSVLTIVVGRSFDSDYDKSRSLPVDQSIVFRPNKSGSYHVDVGPLLYDHDLGEDLNFSRGQMQRRSTGFSFPFFGEQYDVIHVLHGPMIYLGDELREDGWGGYRPQPIIAPVIMNLDPSAGGGVFVKNTIDRLTITWFEIPEYGSPNTNTIQLVLRSDGSFTFAYPQLAPDNRFSYSKFHEKTTATLVGKDAGVRGGHSEPFPPTLIGIHPGAPKMPLEPIRFSDDLPFDGTRPSVLFQAFDIAYFMHIHSRMSPLAIAVVVSAVLILLGFPAVLRTSLIQPLNTLYRGMQRAGQGDLTGRIAALHNDEIGYLSRSFNQMLQAIQVAEAERELTAERTRQQQQQLMRTDKLTSLGILTQFLAHEINNANQAPLANIATLRQITTDLCSIAGEHWEDGYLVGGLDADRLKVRLPQILDATEQCARHIDGIVKNLRAFSREEPKTRSPDVELNEVVQSGLDLVMSLARSFTDHLDVELSPELLPLEANPVMLEQVVINLVMNACQALPDRNRHVLVRTDREGESVILQVTDGGCGIPDCDLARVKDLFFTTRRSLGGTGLGLYVSDTIVREHNGRLDIHSVKGQGTTVTVILPGTAKHD